MGATLNKLKKVIMQIDSVIGKISRYFWYIAGAASLLLAIDITYNVIRRYVFHHQDPYAFAASCALTCIAAMFALAYVQYQRQHIRVDLLDRYVSKNIVNIIQNLVSPIFGLICAGAIVWFSWRVAWNSFLAQDIAGGGVVAVPSWPGRMIIPLTSGILGLVILSQLVSYFASLIRKTEKGKIKPETLPDAKS
jgi:C4-dicarboxylate transporter, DctQ subunit